MCLSKFKHQYFFFFQKTRLTASAGIGPNLMLAKIGSDLNKPNGQAFIPSEKDSILGFMKDLPLRKVSKKSLVNAIFL